MKKLHLSDDQIDSLDPQTIVVAQWVGSDDILVQSLDQIIDSIRMDNDVPADIALDLTNSKALDIRLKDVSGNSFEIIVVKDNLPFKL